MLAEFLLLVLGPRVGPEQYVGAVPELHRLDQIVCGHQLNLRLVDVAGAVAVEDLAERLLLELRDRAFALLPRAAAAPNRMPYQLFDASASPSSFQTSR